MVRTCSPTVARLMLATPLSAFTCGKHGTFHIPRQDTITVPTQRTWRWRVITLLVIAQPPHQSGFAQSRGSDANSPGMRLGYAARRGHRDTPNPRVPSPWQWAWGHSPPRPSSPDSAPPSMLKYQHKGVGLNARENISVICSETSAKYQGC